MWIRRRTLLDRSGPFRLQWLHPSRRRLMAAVRRALSVDDHRAALELSARLAPDGRALGWSADGTPWVYGAVPETATFLAEVDGRIVGAASLIPDSAGLGLPGDETFGRELALLRQMEPPVAQMVTAIGEACPTMTSLAELVRAAIAQALHDGYGAVFTQVPPVHARLLEEIFQFDAWGRHALAGGRRVEAKRLSLLSLGRRFQQADRALGREAFLCDYFVLGNPYHRRVPAWEAEAAARFADAEFVERLTAACGIRLAACTRRQRRVLRERWGDDVFARIAGPAGHVAR